ncbi:ATP-binding protein [Bacillus sp. DJP31]|uniref:ATP-binding protein n=1 Tax=Bacillus sp. DJP31 TaxID=3409789 RepID=UPI003BB6211B
MTPRACHHPIKNYRKRFANLKPDSAWNEHDDIEFLSRIGGWAKDRATKKEGITVAGLLMFGEEQSISEYFPHYFLDYRETLSDIPEQRWSNRITSQDGTWSGNLYDFYFKVIGKITSDIDVPFQLVGTEFIRQTESRVHKALREAVLNTLIHANYFGEVGIVIEKKKSYFRFSNPGILRMPYEKAIEGGISDPRNPFIFKIFAQIGLGERSGYGLESIHTTWKQQHWKKPALLEEFQPERTSLTLLPTSLLPEDIVFLIRETLKDRFHLLTPIELLVLVTAYQEKSVTNVRLQALINKHSLEIKKSLLNLVEEGLILPRGDRGTGTLSHLAPI